MVGFVKVNNTVDCFQDPLVIYINVETRVGIIAIKIIQLAVNKVDAIDAYDYMTVIVSYFP